MAYTSIGKQKTCNFFNKVTNFLKFFYQGDNSKIKEI